MVAEGYGGAAGVAEVSASELLMPVAIIVFVGLCVIFLVIGPFFDTAPGRSAMYWLVLGSATVLIGAVVVWIVWRLVVLIWGF